jgi:general secretion pathway protein F
MALYAWKGLDGAGKAVSGTREADGPKTLRQSLRKESVFLTEMREVVGGARGKTVGKAEAKGLNREVDFSKYLERVTPQDVAIFTRQLATLLRAGIPLAEALGALADQTDNKKFQLILGGVRQKVNEGGALADALKEHAGIFPDLYVNMVRSGEAAGNLDQVLERLADFLDAQHALRQKVSGALTYPIIMMIVGSLVMGLLMVVVVPQITAIFEDAGKALPWNTQLLIIVAGILGGYWWLVIPIGIGGYVLFRRWSRSSKGRGQLDRLMLRAPLVGPLVRFLAVARFARTLATMLASGVPVLTAMEIVKRVLNNAVLEKVVEDARDAVREGESLAVTLKRSQQFPSMMCHMVAVGERSGQLEAMLANVAEAYERDVSAKVARLTTILSPLMIVFMAIGVGFVVYSIIMPIMDMQQFVQ